MRFRPLVALLFAIPAFALVALIVSRILGFTQIFFKHAGAALTQEEVEARYNSSSDGTLPEYIPRIIHQVFHNWKDHGNETLPGDWDAVRRTCIQSNPDFEYHLWTESKSLEFITAEYGWFLSTYEGYKYPVQRVDALRYFLMRHYGGIYIDLDNGCSRDLKPLLSLPGWVTDGGQGALSNNILAARPGHPYWTMMTDSLIPWGYNYLFPYFTIMYASGQWYETAIWQKYHAQLPAEPDEGDRLYRIMMDMRPGAARWVFFTQGRGGSWDNWDNHFFGFIGNMLIPWITGHIFLLALIGGAVGGLVWYRRKLARRAGYRAVANGVEEREMV
ncbi:nucleotide-diphospho-sugar transferase [Lasiosphaeris hirsuta]|uniref:Nucleotide-diphospho-sugar transferase n=1 Tax=Lasiosphaeris hirsuta TaxID=260670 RepID=A0AA40AGB4_9PEZI|nr:nucleotide-diphospho-sugar transferase [Lasiosphaeris hirsuta]